MSIAQDNVTDLNNDELMSEFKFNHEVLMGLTTETKSAFLKKLSEKQEQLLASMKRNLLEEDVKAQRRKIEMINNVLEVVK